MPQQYKDPAGGIESSVGTQLNTFYWARKALIETRKKQVFTQLSSVTGMPKHMGKTIKKFQYIPLLDDRNINDQGIDAAGVTITSAQYFVTLPAPSMTFAVEADATAAAAAVNAIETATAVKSGSATPWTVTFTKTSLNAATQAQSNAVLAAVKGATARQGSGNLYGSSKDVGTITGKLPALTENGGRVNRVGFKRVEIEGSISKMGFFHEYTKESLDFDTDDELYEHLYRELVSGAVELSEDALQIDLLTNAGIVKYTGAATSKATLDEDCELTYGDLLRLSIDLDNNRTPKQTKMITGTRMVDTRTIAGGRVAYVGSELIPLLDGLVDAHGNPAFIPVHKYAAGANTLEGEIGTVGHFRIVVVDEMMRWEGAGADASTVDTHYETNDKFDVFPFLVVGSESFTTIGFQTEGKNTKFTVFNKKPGEGTADRNDPYGEMGFSSIKWYYGTLFDRPERIALLLTTAPM